jgi:hypothetical protein
MNTNSKGEVIRKVKVLLSFCFAFGSVYAGTIEQATIVADPQMQVKNGVVEGCGYRLKAIPKSFQTNRQPVLLDASFNVYVNGPFGLVKGGAVQVENMSGKVGKPVNRPIESFWIKAQGARPTTPTEKRIPSDTKGYLLYEVSVADVMRLFQSVLELEPLTLGMRLKGEGVDRIYSGVAITENSSNAAIRRCIADLADTLRSSLSEEEQK